MERQCNRPIDLRQTVKSAERLRRFVSENQPRDGSGEFGEKVSEQDILEVFDLSADPFLTATEIAGELPISRQAVYHRLEGMREKGLVNRKKTGARSAGWWSTVAPRLDPDVADSSASAEREGAVSLEDLEAEFDEA